MQLSAEDIRNNLRSIRKRMHSAATRSGRQPDDIRLLAVSKYMSMATVRYAMSAGQHCFGENTLQDARKKQALIDDPANEWHFIGHLQTNKAKHIPENFDWLHTLDSMKLAKKLSDCALRSTCTLNILLQVNIADDPEKSGLPATTVFHFIDELLRADCTGLQLHGLMTIGRQNTSMDEHRRDFHALRELRDACAARFDATRFTELSMGMSGDFEAAIDAGATMIRIGSSIFGPRPQGFLLPADGN